MRAPIPPIRGSGSRKPKRARLGIVCTTPAIPRIGRRQARPARQDDPERNPAGGREQGRDRDEHDVLAGQREDLGAPLPEVAGEAQEASDTNSRTKSSAGRSTRSAFVPACRMRPDP